MKNIKWLTLICAFCVCITTNVLATSLAVYQSAESQTLLFYADGNAGFANIEYEGWYPSDEVKYCPPSSSAWSCVVGLVSFAYPKDTSIKEWCFAGSRFSKDASLPVGSNEKIHVLASNRYKLHGKQFDETNRFVFDSQRGLISFYSEGDTRYALVSRTGIMGEEFTRDMSNLLTEEELDYLLGKCNNPHNSYEIDKKIFGKEPTID